MCEEIRKVTATIFLLPLLCFVGVAIEAELQASEFSEASFTYEDVQTKLVFFISSSGGMRGAEETLRVYGDGKAVSRTLKGGRLVTESVFHLNSTQVREILQTAVGAGLIEWDETEIQARLLEAQPGSIRNLPPSERPTVTILISLDTYSRGALSIEDVEKRIRFKAPEWAAEVYPQVLEIVGIAQLAQIQRSLRAQAENPS